MIAITISWWPWYARMVRAEVLTLRGAPYVEAARLMNVSWFRILLRHVVPAVHPPTRRACSDRVGLKFALADSVDAQKSVAGEYSKRAFEVGHHIPL